MNREKIEPTIDDVVDKIFTRINLPTSCYIFDFKVGDVERKEPLDLSHSPITTTRKANIKTVNDAVGIRISSLAIFHLLKMASTFDKSAGKHLVQNNYLNTTVSPACINNSLVIDPNSPEQGYDFLFNYCFYVARSLDKLSGYQAAMDKLLKSTDNSPIINIVSDLVTIKKLQITRACLKVATQLDKTINLIPSLDKRIINKVFITLSPGFTLPDNEINPLDFGLFVWKEPRSVLQFNETTEHNFGYDFINICPVFAQLDLTVKE